jgi:ABC-type polysaccharide/polyol phosphate export permease
MTSVTANTRDSVVYSVQADAPLERRLAATLSQEIIGAFRAWRIWTVMGWDDIRQRYRRSVLGPFWITLSMAFFILILGMIYSRLFHMNLERYMPYLTIGYVVWGFMAAATNDSCSAFHDSTKIIKQIKLPFMTYIMRVIWRNFIVFLHTVVIYIPVAIYFKVEPNWNWLLALPGLALICINVIWVATVIAVLSTRYRDIQPIVNTIIQLGMFATPIMWPVSSLGNERIFADINPVYHLIEITRAPLLGDAPAQLSWVVSGGMAVVGSLVAIALLVRTSRRIVFWI